MTQHYKRKQGRTNLRMIETVCNYVFLKLVSLPVFHIHFSYLLRLIYSNAWKTNFFGQKAVILSFSDDCSSFMVNKVA